MNIREINVAKNNMPAAALISLSFKTGMSYPSTFSPNCIRLFIFLVFAISIRITFYKNTQLKKACKAPVNKQRFMVTKRRKQVKFGHGGEGEMDRNAPTRNGEQ